MCARVVSEHPRPPPSTRQVGLYYPVANILANCHTTLYGSQTSEYFRVPYPSLEEYLEGTVLPPLA